jgi:serine palmitoyltransferase
MIVVEGVYANSGDVAPLQQLYSLKEAYRYRLCVEESHAFGVLGQQGRGACEAAGLQPGQVGDEARFLKHACACCVYGYV